MVGNGIRRRACLTWFAAAAAQWTTSWPAVAQDAAAAAAFPNRPIRFLVPYPPGGGNDFFARVLSQKMSENLNQPVVIDNRAGAAGLIAGDALAKAPPDGYTIMVDQSSIATNMLTYKKRQFDARKDIVPLMLGVTLDNVVLVGSESPVRSLADLIAQGKRPDSIAYASTGIGSSQHLAMELLCNEAGIKLLHVPYKGTAAAITALVAGEVQVFIISVPTAQGYIKDGRVRAIATTGLTRSAVMPEVPTVKESGFPKFVNVNWLGIFTTRGTPEAVQTRLSAELVKALSDARVREGLTRQGWSVEAGPPSALSKIFEEEIARYERVVQMGNIRID